MKTIFYAFFNACHPFAIRARRSSLLGLPWSRRCRASLRTSAHRGSWWWPGPPWSGSSWSPPPSSCPSCRSGSWRSRNSVPTSFTESIGPFPRLSQRFQACKKNSVSFAVLCRRRRADIELGITEYAASLAGVTESHVTSRDTSAVTHHWHPLLLRPARFT